MPAKTDPPLNTQKFFAMTVPNCKKVTLIPTLKYKIHEKSIVWTDGWSSYFTLGKHFDSWEYVNHSRHFKYPTVGYLIRVVGALLPGK